MLPDTMSPFAHFGRVSCQNNLGERIKAIFLALRLIANQRQKLKSGKRRAKPNCRNAGSHAPSKRVILTSGDKLASLDSNALNGFMVETQR